MGILFKYTFIIQAPTGLTVPVYLEKLGEIGVQCYVRMIIPQGDEATTYITC